MTLVQHERAVASSAPMYEVQRNGKTILEADACGIGFLASRKGVPERAVVESALELIKCFDHRGAPGHGAGVQLDIPWPLLLERFSAHAMAIAQRDVAVGMFFLPFESSLRQRCVNRVEELASLAGAELLEWADVPICPQALPAGSSALRTLPIVRQALFKRPAGLSEQGWFICRYLLRLALDNDLGKIAGDEFAIVSLSNRTIVYKGLSELSRISDLYPDLDHPSFASRYVLFHSRYCTNTTTAWRRAQPFWAIAHNGEISTIAGNRSWMTAIGRDLIGALTTKHPSLSKIGEFAHPIICSGGSDTANLDDMMIALLAGGLSLPQSILALLPPSGSTLPEVDKLSEFYEAAAVYFGACDGPAAIVACDGDHAVAHLDRNGLRPLWFVTTKDFVMATSELTGTLSIGEVEEQRIMGPGETALVKLNDGEVLWDLAVQEEVSRKPFHQPGKRLKQGGTSAVTSSFGSEQELVETQVAFGLTEEDVDVLLKPLFESGKAAIGSMGDDTPPAAMLDALPRRLEDHFALRFAQETSPPIDPIRDAWVFDTRVVLGDRRGPWHEGKGPLFRFDSPIFSDARIQWLSGQSTVETISLEFDAAEGFEGHEKRLNECLALATDFRHFASGESSQARTVIVFSDRKSSRTQATVQPLRLIRMTHRALVEAGMRNRVSLVADVGVWDIQHCSLLLTMGADAVCPWLGEWTAAASGIESAPERYIKGIHAGVVESMSMMGVTPTTAYCGAGLVEAIGLDHDWVREEFDVPVHLGGIGRRTVVEEWLSFHSAAYGETPAELIDAGEYRHSKGGRPHANNAEIVRALHIASGFQKKIHAAEPGSKEAYNVYSSLVSGRKPVTPLDCLKVREENSIPIESVEPAWLIAWRFMAPGMSEGALSEPAHRAVARGMNVLARYCRLAAHISGETLPGGIGPIANSGEGGFDKARVKTHDFNRSVQYAGGRFTITPMTAACAEEAEVKFAQGAKPGKGGQLPGKKVSEKVAIQRGCEPGYELVSPPINHNLYSIEDVKLMLESWRRLNPKVNCALKYVATYGVEMVAVGGVNAGANRLHLSDGCGGTGAAKRVDQKHAGIPSAVALPTVHDALIEEGARHLVELSVDGGVQNGEQALKLFLLGADRVGFGTSLLISIGCSMLRKCHMSGPDPSDPTGKRRLGCTPGIATQDPQWIARFAGNWKHVARVLLFVAEEVRERMAAAGIRTLVEAIGRRDLLMKKPDLEGKAAQLDLASMVGAPHGRVQGRTLEAQTKLHSPKPRKEELQAARDAMEVGANVFLAERLTNSERCVGVGAAGMIAREFGDLGLPKGCVRFEHGGAAGHFYAAYSVHGLKFKMTGVVADSCFTAAYGGELAILPEDGREGLCLVGNAFGYGARGGTAFIAGKGGNRFGICFRQSHERTGPTVVVEGVAANAFQYMTGGVAVVLGPTGFNLGSGMTGGKVFLLDPVLENLNQDYVEAVPLDSKDRELVISLIERHMQATQSKVAEQLVRALQWDRFVKIQTKLAPEVLS